MSSNSYLGKIIYTGFGADGEGKIVSFKMKKGENGGPFSLTIKDDKDIVITVDNVNFSMEFETNFTEGSRVTFVGSGKTLICAVPKLLMDTLGNHLGNNW